MVPSAAETTVTSDYCREKAAPEGSGFYYAVLFEPQKNRDLLYALIALHNEVLECLTGTTDPGVSLMKLHWWREELQRMFQRQPRHPATRQLLPAVDSGILEPDGLELYLQTLNLVITGNGPDGTGECLEEAVPGLGQIWGVAATLSSRAGGRQAERLPARNGGLLTLLELMQNVRVLAAKGYNFPPGALSGEHTPGTMQAPDHATLYRDCIIRIANGLDECYRDIKKDHYQYPLFHLIMNRIARITCTEILEDGCRLQTHRISLTPLRKLWIAGRIRMTVKLRSSFPARVT